MKATELMLGDYVQFFNENLKKTQYEKVTSIKIDDGTRYIQTAESDVYYREEIYESIPLTLEILAKNGFYPDCDKEDIYKNKSYCYGCYICIRHFLGDFSFGEMLYHYDTQRFNSWFSILNVHELQHALKLCGIDKEIVL